MNEQVSNGDRRYPLIAATVFGECWAIIPERLEVIAELVELRISGGKLTEAEVESRSGKGRTRFGQVRGKVAVLPLYGVMMQHAGVMTDMSGGTDADTFGAEFDSLMANRDIGAIVLDVDSPGGSVYGLDELSTKIHAARGSKPVIAVANSVMASGAYWVASSADEIVVTPGGEVGSIGAIAIHTDTSKADEEAGVKYTIVKQGKFKATGNSYEPLDSEGLREIQSGVDRYYDMFVGSVARNRGITVRSVRTGYGEGRMLGASEALELGMVDRIASLEDVINRLGGDLSAASKGTRAEEEESKVASYSLVVGGKEIATGTYDELGRAVESEKDATEETPDPEAESQDGTHTDTRHKRVDLLEVV